MENIQENLNAGNDLNTIRTGLTKELGDETNAFRYVDMYIEALQKYLNSEEGLG